MPHVTPQNFHISSSIILSNFEHSQQLKNQILQHGYILKSIIIHYYNIGKTKEHNSNAYKQQYVYISYP
jgi:hypothetical protein